MARFFSSFISFFFLAFFITITFLASSTSAAPVPSRVIAIRDNTVGSSGGGSVAKWVKQKRCYFIGTMFKIIDCNAPANSTAIPFAPKATTTSLPAA